MANRSTIETKAPLLSGKEINVGGNGKHNIQLKVNRNTVIRIKRDESRKQGDKNSHKRNGTNDRNSKDRRLQNSDTIQGDFNCPCEPQRGIRSVGLSGREVQHPHGILDLWKKTKRIAPDVPEIKS